MSKFRIGDRVASERANGVIIDMQGENVDVRWDDGGTSFRPAYGLSRSTAPKPMSPEQVVEAREKLGPMWGLDRPLHNSELARALRLTGRDPGRSVEAWSKPLASGGTPISGPASVAILMMLEGTLPPDPMETILRSRRS